MGMIIISTLIMFRRPGGIFRQMAVFRLLHCLNGSARGTAEKFLVFEEGHSLCSKKNHSLCLKIDIPCVRRRTFLVFEERHSLCSKKNISCVQRRRNADLWSYRPQEWCI